LLGRLKKKKNNLRVPVSFVCNTEIIDNSSPAQPFRQITGYGMSFDLSMPFPFLHTRSVLEQFGDL